MSVLNTLMEDKTVLELFFDKCLERDVRERVAEGPESLTLDQLISLVAEDDDSPYLLNGSGRKALPLLQHPHFLPWLHNQEMRLPPLELLCYLHKADLLQISTFLYFKPEFCEEMGRQLVDIVTKEFCCGSDKEAASNIVRILLSWMINVGTQTLRELYTLSSALMESFTIWLMKALFTDGRELRMDFMGLLLEKGVCGVFEKEMKCFGRFVVNSLLLNSCPSLSLMKALSIHQKELTIQHIPHKFNSIYHQLEELLGVEAIITEVQLAVDQQRQQQQHHGRQLNLLHLLYVVALISSHHDLVRGGCMSEEWLKVGLSERDENLVGLALLVTRHHFAHVSKYLVGYANWFGSIQMKNSLTVNFLFEFLSKLVPQEPAVFLKIQVTKVPSGPPSCQSVISDYVCLARTRLADMNQTYDCISLFNDFHETLEEQQESDVNRVVAHFRENGEVSKAVLEANVFRKHYYDKVFLPCLLSAPRGSDPPRDALIIKLNTLGKISSSLYRAWSRSSK